MPHHTVTDLNHSIYIHRVSTKLRNGYMGPGKCHTRLGQGWWGRGWCQVMPVSGTWPDPEETKASLGLRLGQEHTHTSIHPPTHTQILGKVKFKNYRWQALIYLRTYQYYKQNRNTGTVNWKYQLPTVEKMGTHTLSELLVIRWFGIINMS